MTPGLRSIKCKLASHVARMHNDKSEKLTLNGEKILEPDCCFEGFFDGVSFTLFARGKSNASSTTDGIVLPVWNFVPSWEEGRGEKIILADAFCG